MTLECLKQQNHMKHQKIQLVHDDQERCVSQPQEFQKIIEQHFMKHFNQENINQIKKFITGAKSLNRKITPDEVKTAVWKMGNNKALGKDNINVELLKYAPKEICKEIAIILNGIYERNDTRIKLGTGILLLLLLLFLYLNSVKILKYIKSTYKFKLIKGKAWFL